MNTKFNMWTVTYVTKEGSRLIKEFYNIQDVMSRLTDIRKEAKSEDHINIFPPESNLTTDELNHLYEKLVEEDQRINRRFKLISQLIDHDREVYKDELEKLVDFVNERGALSVFDYYSNRSDYELNLIARDYLNDGEFTPIH